MAIWSSLRSNINKLLSNVPMKSISAPTIRLMSGGHEHRVMNITPSRFQYKKFKDLLHFYSLLGFIPVGLLIFYANIFIGPAQLTETPESYTPKYWEYYKSPITRWLARYIFTSPQQEYEKYLHQLYEEDEKIKIRQLQKKVMDLMAQRNDYQAFFYVPVSAKYIRISRKEADQLADIGGWIGPKEGP